ncbi:MAG: beta-lactamase family protein [Planctomycetaceae bacterium]|nr:beta-lactamase family protein [Planctomycetaceae bacterium]
MSRFTLTLLMVFASCVSLVIPAIAEEIISVSDSVANRIDRSVHAQMEQQKLVGVCVGVIRNGRVVLTRGYGFEDRETSIPMTTDSMIRWASISKTLTAVVVGQLAAEGKLNLNEDVRRLVPEFPDHGAVITARDLLCHQGGIVHYSNGPVVRTPRQYDTAHPFMDVVLALDTFKDSPLVNRPREKYSYSTHAYILLSAVAQRAESKPFADLVRQRICRPLKLTSLRPDYQWENIPHRAVGYRLNGGRIERSSDTDVSWKLGGGGYISNINDLAGFAAGLIDESVLSNRSKSVMWKPQETSDGKLTSAGLGFFVDGKGTQLRVAHNGSQEKAKTRLVIYPNRRDGVVVMSNSENADPGRITTAIYQALSQP